MIHGSNCAAFFDLDGTLLAPPSLERRFVRYLIKRGKLGSINGGRWLLEFLLRIGCNLTDATEGNKTYLANLPTPLAEDWAASAEFDSLPFFFEGLIRLMWHAGQGHKIFILSGSLAPLVRAISARLPVPAQNITVCATELETRDGHWTGRIRDELISGVEKARSARSLAKLFGIEMARSFAYADRFSDAAILGSVGFPLAVNPSRRLRRHAMKRCWPIAEWIQLVSTSQATTPQFLSRIATIPQFQEKQ